MYLREEFILSGGNYKCELNTRFISSCQLLSTWHLHVGIKRIIPYSWPSYMYMLYDISEHILRCS